MYPFSDGSFAPRNAWYVAALAHEIDRSLTGRTILGDPVVLYRKENGVAVAVGGRCPHRHYPLAASCLTGDTIVCGYHGIAFDADGACTDIPSQDFVPRAYRIPTYPLVEHGMWAWIWPGDPALADPALLPDLEEIGFAGHGDTPVPLFFREVACRYQLLNDNLLDLTHLAFLHGSSIGVRENASTPVEVTQEAGVIRGRRTIIGAAPTPVVASRHPGVTRVDQIVGMDFHLPGFHAGIGDHVGSSDDPARPGERLQSSRVFHAVTPATQHSCYYWFGMVSLGNQIDPAQAQASLAPVIDEDVFASEEIEKMLQLVGGRPRELMLRSDLLAVNGRRMLQEMMDAEAGQSGNSADHAPAPAEGLAAARLPA
jgi:phenylpropionate dioxygenase-like ring-hydroxylating dioxygenase large terminal subunit